MKLFILFFSPQKVVEHLEYLQNEESRLIVGALLVLILKEYIFYPAFKIIQSKEHLHL